MAEQPLGTPKASNVLVDARSISQGSRRPITANPSLSGPPYKMISDLTILIPWFWSETLLVNSELGKSDRYGHGRDLIDIG